MDELPYRNALRPGDALPSLATLKSFKACAGFSSHLFIRIICDQLFKPRLRVGIGQIRFLKKVRLLWLTRCESMGAVSMTLGCTILRILATIVFVLAPARQLRAAPTEEPPLLTLAQQVRQLSPEEAERHYPVHLHGIVLYYDQANYRDLIIQDATSGIYIDHTAQRGYRLTAGDLVEVTGCTAAGGFSPEVIVSNLLVTGHEPLPPVREVSYERLASGVEEAQWVKIRGIIRSASWPASPDRGTLWLDLMTSGGRVKARVGQCDPTVIGPLVDCEVSLSGVCTPVFNRRRQLLDVWLSVPGAEQIHIEKPASADPYAMAARPISSLRRFEPEATSNHRIQVEGVVTLQEPGRSLFIRDATQGLWVKTRLPTLVEVGDRVKVVGFASSIGYSLILEDAVFKRVGAGVAPAPLKATLQEAGKGHFDSELVELEAQLLDWIPNPNEHVLVLQEKEAIFRAYLPRRGNMNKFKPLPLHSRLRLTGICLIQVEPDPRLQSFRLLLRSPVDLAVIQQPSWWTLGRVLWALGGTSILTLLALGWVVTLHRQVRSQTAVIQQKVEREAVLEERTRIAREFHDTIEQQLAAVALQLQAARVRVEESPEFVHHVLRLADSMLRHAQSEARHSVWDLRSVALENGSLRDALSAVANYAGNGAGVQVQVSVTGDAGALPSRTENHLLRIGQEAATNAVKHGGAKNLWIRLHYTSDALKMTLQDDGKGFDVDAAGSGPAGHFGLLGMRERAEKMGAQLAITSTAGQGTEIAITVPLAVQASAASESA